MNNLNSVLIEGELKTDVAVDTSEPKVVMFTIASKSAEEVNYLDIEATGKLAKSCLTKAHKGRRVRIVGRIRQPKGKPAVIVAEHVEFMLEFKKGTTEDE